MLGPAQLKFLEEDLQKNRNRRPKFVFFHKPFWLVLLKAGNTGFPLHALAKQFGVDYVVSGHGHQFVRLVRDGVTYMEVGSWAPISASPGGWIPASTVARFTTSSRRR
jgi:3',5'-cyclic AMP phosphodiesterase CpdA